MLTTTGVTLSAPESVVDSAGPAESDSIDVSATPGVDNTPGDHPVDPEGLAREAVQAAVDKHTEGINRIVGLIRSKYEDESTRNFEIGREALDLAIRQRESVGAKTYTKADFDNQMARIRDEVRYFVPIKPESIQVAVWVRCFAMRAKVGEDITPERAALLSMYDYKIMLGEGFRWNSADLEGTLNPCWLDMIKGVAQDRSGGVVVQSVDFENRVVSTIKRAAEARLEKLDPVKAASAAVSKGVKASAEAIARTVKDVYAALDSGISRGTIKPGGALSILESVAKSHGVPLIAASIGFDPITASVEDCEMLIAAMFGAGRRAQLQAIMEKSSRAIAIMERAEATAAQSVAAAGAKAKAA